MLLFYQFDSISWITVEQLALTIAQIFCIDYIFYFDCSLMATIKNDSKYLFDFMSNTCVPAGNAQVKKSNLIFSCDKSQSHKVYTFYHC